MKNRHVVGKPQVGIGVAHGSFGELLQGALANEDAHFLVTLPIQNFSRVTLIPDPSVERFTVTPVHKLKSLALVRLLADHFGVSCGGHLHIESELPEGKGMSSSSADLVAAARAFEAATGCVVPSELMHALLRSIEPTDGVMYSEFVSFFHRRVELRRRLGSPDRLAVVAIDEGGKVDTIEYNRRNRGFCDAECAEYAELLPAIETAILQNDLEEVGRISTRSAILNQKRNPKRDLDSLVEIGQRTRALGVAVAHSGSVLGLLFPDEAGCGDRIEDARAQMSKLRENVFVVHSLTSPMATAAAGVDVLPAISTTTVPR